MDPVYIALITSAIATFGALGGSFIISYFNLKGLDKTGQNTINVEREKAALVKQEALAKELRAKAEEAESKMFSALRSMEQLCYLALATSSYSSVKTEPQQNDIQNNLASAIGAIAIIELLDEKDKLIYKRVKTRLDLMIQLDVKLLNTLNEGAWSGGHNALMIDKDDVWKVREEISQAILNTY